MWEHIQRALTDGLANAMGKQRTRDRSSRFEPSQESRRRLGEQAYLRMLSIGGLLTVDGMDGTPIGRQRRLMDGFGQRGMCVTSPLQVLTRGRELHR